MKKMFVQLSAVAFMALGLSCGDNKEVSIHPGDPTLSVIPSVTDIVFAANGIAATANGLSILPTFRVVTNQSSWRVMVNKTWVSISKKDDQFTLSASPNIATAPEPAEITVSTGDATPVRIGVQQLAGALLTVKPEYRDIGFMNDGVTGWVSAAVSGEASGKIFTPVFTVTTSNDNLLWDALSDQSWLTVTKDGNTFTLTAIGIDPLPEAKITVTGGTEPVTITVNRKGARYTPAGSLKTGGIVDLALIYNGDTRIDWTQETIKPFLTWTNPDTQKEEWLFDGFLFLDGTFKNFNFTYNRPTIAKKEDMLNYLDNMLFVKNKSLDALDKALDETIQRLGPPPRPRRIVLMATDQPPMQKNWGELNGKTMDCSNPEDRFAIAKWFIDQMMARWETAAYQNLELVGLYWDREEIYWYSFDYDLDIEFVKLCTQYIHSLGMRTFWCPYWGAKGSDAWKEIGFDIAYQQPNYFFKHHDYPKSRLRESCHFAERLGMGMENEWGMYDLLSDLEYHIPRMRYYLDGFEQYGVWHDAAVMHYMGGAGPAPGLLGLSQSTHTELVALYHQLCSILAERQKRYALLK